MTLLWMDGCDHVSMTALGGKHNWVRDTNQANWTLSGGVFGQGAFHVSGAGDYDALVFPPNSNFTLGFWFVMHEFETAHTIAQWNDPQGDGNNGRLVIDQYGKLRWDRFTTVLLRSSQSIPLSTWNFIEWHIECSNSISTSGGQVMLNGQLFLDLPAGTDTLHNATDGLLGQLLFGKIAGVDCDFDDMYLLDGSGPVSTFLGPLKIDTVWPASEGTAGTAWDPVDGASAALDVDNRNHDGDATYIHASETDNLQTFELTQFSADQTASVHAVAINLMVTKKDAGTRRVIPVIEASGTSYDGVSFVPPVGGYKHFQHIVTSNPSDTGDIVWAVSEVCAASFGIALTV